MKAMIFAAGMGSRLGPLTDELPKPMLDVEGVPLLERIVRQLASQGIRKLVLNLHYRPEVIQRHFGDGAAWGVEIAYSHERTLLGTAGALRRAEPLLRGSEPILAHYGDILTDQDFGRLVRRHLETRAIGTLLLHRRSGSNSVADVDPEGRITSFLERPTVRPPHAVGEHWAFSGVCVCSPALLREIPIDVPWDLPRDVFPRLVPTGRLYGFPLDGYRCAIDNPTRLAEACAAVRENRYAPTRSQHDAEAPRQTVR